MISQQTTEEFQEIIKVENDQSLTFEKSAELAQPLVDYFNLLAEINHRLKTKKTPKKTGQDKPP